jgi:pilus assembly protein Flp/PilA
VRLHSAGSRKSRFRRLRDRLAVPDFHCGDAPTKSIVSGANHLKKLLVAFVEDDAGLTMVEYAIAGALVTSAAVVAFTNLAGAIVARITFIVLAINT